MEKNLTKTIKNEIYNKNVNVYKPQLHWRLKQEFAYFALNNTCFLNLVDSRPSIDLYDLVIDIIDIIIISSYIANIVHW